jgi:Protein of unknown function (DUF2442)
MPAKRTMRFLAARSRMNLLRAARIWVLLSFQGVINVRCIGRILEASFAAISRLYRGEFRKRIPFTGGFVGKRDRQDRPRLDPQAHEISHASGDDARLAAAHRRHHQQRSLGMRYHLPLPWFPRLFQATPEQRGNWRLISKGIGIHWPLIDEDVSVASVLSVE